MENTIEKISNQNVLRVALEAEESRNYGRDLLMSYSEAYGGERA
jgi:hypothetical protein